MGRHEVMEQAVNDLRALAVVLHSSQCGYNHIDQCGWDYEADGVVPGTSKANPWIGETHERWAKKAEKIAARLAAKGISLSQAIEVIKTVKLGDSL